MKSRRQFLQAASLLTTSTCLATDPFIHQDIDQSMLSGQWTASLGNVRHTIIFDGDGTFKGICRVDGRITDHYEGEWVVKVPYLSAPEFVWKYLKSDHMAPGRVDRDTLETLNSKMLILWTAGGAKHVYQRVPATK